MSIRRQMVSGAAWMVALRLLLRVIGMLGTIILARLLAPEDFGLVAMATVIMGLVLMLSEMNVQAVLIQRPEIDDTYLNGAFGLRLLVSLVQGLFLGLAAIPVSSFYGEPRLELIVYVLAAAVALDGLSNIGTVMFQRDLQFHREFLMRAIPKIAAFVVTVGVAFATRSHWALVSGIVTNHVGRVILSYVMSPYRPWPSREHWAEIFRFSKWLIINQLLGFLGRRGPELLLGRLGGARSVGLFSVSYQIAMLPTTEMATPINRVVFPGYSRMTATEGELRRGYLDVAGLIALFAVPAGAGVSVSASVLIPLLLGDKWTDAIPLVEVIAIAGAMMALLTNSNAVFLALGRPYITTVIAAVYTSLVLAGVFYGATVAGPWGAALSYLVVISALLPVQLILTLRIVSARLADYLRVVYRPITATAVMYTVLDWYAIPEVVSLDVPLAVRAPLVVMAGAAVYGGCELLLWQLAGKPPGAEKHAIQIVSTLTTRLRTRLA